MDNHFVTNVYVMIVIAMPMCLTRYLFGHTLCLISIYVCSTQKMAAYYCCVMAVFIGSASEERL